MDVIGHEDVRVHEHAVVPACFRKRTQVDAEVLLSQEAGTPINAALHDMQRQIGKEEAGTAWHRAPNRMVVETTASANQPIDRTGAPEKGRRGSPALTPNSTSNATITALTPNSPVRDASYR
jgi:hypothetical protein